MLHVWNIYIQLTKYIKNIFHTWSIYGICRITKTTFWTPQKERSTSTSPWRLWVFTGQIIATYPPQVGGPPNDIKWWWIGSGNPPKIFLIQVSELWWLTQILGGAFHSRSLVIYLCLFIYIRWFLLRILPWDSSPLFTTHWGIFLFF